MDPLHMERQKAATRRTRCFSLVALGNTKFPPAFVWVRDFFPLNLFSVEFKTMSMKLSKFFFDLISSCLTDELIEKRYHPLSMSRGQTGHIPVLIAIVGWAYQLYLGLT